MFDPGTSNVEGYEGEDCDDADEEDEALHADNGSTQNVEDCVHSTRLLVD